MPVVRHHLARQHRHRIGPHRALSASISRNGVIARAISTCARIASACTPASVRPAACTVDRLAGHRMRRALDRRLHARPMRLPLPAHERAGRHIPRSARSRVTKPRARRNRDSRAAAQPTVIAASPCALHEHRAERASTAGDGQTVIEHRPDVAPATARLTVSPISAASTRTARPAYSKNAPGAGLNARTCRSTSTAPARKVDPRLGLVDLGGIGHAVLGLRNAADRRRDSPAPRPSAPHPSPPIPPSARRRSCDRSRMRASSRTGPVSSPASICMIAHAGLVIARPGSRAGSAPPRASAAGAIHGR